MVDFEEAKFTYLTQFEDFRWMGYLTTQYLVHENLIRVFFSNAKLETIGENSEDSCWTMATNTYVMGKAIRVT